MLFRSAYLKDPPEGYLLPGVDVIAGMEEIRQKVRDGGYTNQYEFTRDLRGIVRTQRHMITLTLQHTN